MKFYQIIFYRLPICRRYQPHVKEPLADGSPWLNKYVLIKKNEIENTSYFIITQIPYSIYIPPSCDE